MVKLDENHLCSRPFRPTSGDVSGTLVRVHMKSFLEEHGEQEARRQLVPEALAWV